MQKPKATKNFYAHVDPKVNKAFGKQWRSRRQEKNHATTAALKLWLSLSEEMQGIVLHWPELEIELFAQALSQKIAISLRQALNDELNQGERPWGKTTDAG